MGRWDDQIEQLDDFRRSERDKGTKTLDDLKDAQEIHRETIERLSEIAGPPTRTQPSSTSPEASEVDQDRSEPKNPSPSCTFFKTLLDVTSTEEEKVQAREKLLRAPSIHVDDVARVIKRHRATVYRLIDSGELEKKSKAKISIPSLTTYLKLDQF